MKLQDALEATERLPMTALSLGVPALDMLYSAFNAPLANLVDMVYISDELIISQKTVNSSFLLLQLFSQDYFYSFFILEIELLSIAIFSFIVQLKSNKKFISV